MKKRIVSLLRKYPPLYDWVAQVYFNLQPIHIKETLFGGKAQEKAWATRHLHKGNAWNYTNHQGETDEWVQGYWDSRNHSHRAFLVDKIASYNPQTILEVGCNCAPNLYLLAKRLPYASIRGIDINPKAVEYGRNLLAAWHIDNVTIDVAKVADLRKEKYNYDVVFTDAVLIYVLPQDIELVIWNMLDISQQALVLLERHMESPDARRKWMLGVYRYGCWERDYVRLLLSNFLSDRQILVTKITKDIWDEERWQKVGALIEVRK